MEPNALEESEPLADLLEDLRPDGVFPVAQRLSRRDAIRPFGLAARLDPVEGVFDRLLRHFDDVHAKDRYGQGLRFQAHSVAVGAGPLGHITVDLVADLF